MSVSVVMPCYNEEDIIEEVIKTCHSEIISKIDDSELIVVDDCSTDNTPAILKKLANEIPNLRTFRPEVNSGHGKVARMGYEAACKDWVFQIDSDNQFGMGEFWKLYDFKDEYSFILGNRKIRYDPLHRLILAKIIRFVNLIIFRVWLNDANCPFRLIKRQIHNELLAEVNKEALAPNIMIAILAKKRGVRIKEVSVAHHKRNTGSVSIASWKLIKFCLKGLKQLLEFRKSLGRLEK